MTMDRKVIHFFLILLYAASLVHFTLGQEDQKEVGKHSHTFQSPIVPLQPLAQQVRRIEAAMNYLGQPLPPEDHEEINQAISRRDEKLASEELQQILDKYVLAIVEINPESRVKVRQGTAEPKLFAGGTKLFLVKVMNQAGVTAPLEVESPNSAARDVPRPAHNIPSPTLR